MDPVKGFITPLTPTRAFALHILLRPKKKETKKFSNAKGRKRKPPETPPHETQP
jgi:hypothetical protein